MSRLNIIGRREIKSDHLKGLEKQSIISLLSLFISTVFNAVPNFVVVVVFFLSVEHTNTKIIYCLGLERFSNDMFYQMLYMQSW